MFLTIKTCDLPVKWVKSMLFKVKSNSNHGFPVFYLFLCLFMFITRFQHRNQFYFTVLVFSLLFSLINACFIRFYQISVCFKLESAKNMLFRIEVLTVNFWFFNMWYMDMSVNYCKNFGCFGFWEPYQKNKRLNRDFQSFRIDIEIHR